MRPWSEALPLLVDVHVRPTGFGVEVAVSENTAPARAADRRVRK